MSEWLKEHAWKACVGETLPRVRIPLSPPVHKPLNTKDLSHSRHSTESGDLAICVFVNLLARNQAAVIHRIAPSHTERGSQEDRINPRRPPRLSRSPSAIATVTRVGSSRPIQIARKRSCCAPSSDRARSESRISESSYLLHRARVLFRPEVVEGERLFRVAPIFTRNLFEALHRLRSTESFVGVHIGTLRRQLCLSFVLRRGRGRTRGKAVVRAIQCFTGGRAHRGRAYRPRTGWRVVSTIRRDVSR